MAAVEGTWVRSLLVAFLLVGGAISFISCSDDGNNGSAKDAGAVSDGGLFPCKEPGRSCNAHDPCVISAVCGKDNYCHPDMVQSCDDDLDCTEDTCGGPGQCVNTAKEGFCAMLIPDPEGGDSVMTCLQDGTPHPTDPCLKCDAQQSSSKWSGSAGKSCDDEMPCTKDDVCQEGGECRGTYYGGECGDLYECTEDICDGKGGCSNELLEGWCPLDNACYADQEEDASGCFICDTSVDPLAWTPLPNVCKIGALCYTDGEKDSTGCGVCDPAQHATTWTPAADTCLIDGACYQAGQQSSSGCGICDPQQSTSSWSPASGTCLILGSCYASGDKSPSSCAVCDPSASDRAWTLVADAAAQLTDFEGGSGSFTLDPQVQQVGWQVVAKRAMSGTHSLYYGNTATWTYDNGNPNQGSVTSAQVALPTGQKAALQFWLYLDVETGDDFDVLSVMVDDALVWSKGVATIPEGSYKRWVFVEVDLSAYAGQTVQVSFDFKTVDHWANSSEGVYIDDISFVTNCG